MDNSLCPKQQFEDGKFRFVALFAKNREEWIITDMGAQMTGITVVTLYDTLGKESIDYILNQCKIKTCVLSSDKIRLLLELHKEGKLESLHHLIYFDQPSNEDVELAKSLNV